MTSQTKSLIKNVLSFAVGFLAGGGIAAYLVRERYERQLQEESQERIFGRVRESNDVVIPSEIVEDAHKKVITDHRLNMNKYHSLTRDYTKPPLESFKNKYPLTTEGEDDGGVFGFPEEHDEDDEEFNNSLAEDDIRIRRIAIALKPPHQILSVGTDLWEDAEDSEPEDSDIFSEVDVTWYRASDTYVDEDESVIDDPEKMFGTEAMHLLSSTNAGEVTVRNNKLEIIFYINKVDEMFPDPDLMDDSGEIDPMSDETPRERIARINRIKKKELEKLQSLEEEFDE